MIHPFSQLISSPLIILPISLPLELSRCRSDHRILCIACRGSDTEPTTIGMGMVRIVPGKFLPKLTNLRQSVACFHVPAGGSLRLRKFSKVGPPGVRGRKAIVAARWKVEDTEMLSVMVGLAWWGPTLSMVEKPKSQLSPVISGSVVSTLSGAVEFDSNHAKRALTISSLTRPARPVASPISTIERDECSRRTSVRRTRI